MIQACTKTGTKKKNAPCFPEYSFTSMHHDSTRGHRLSCPHFPCVTGREDEGTYGLVISKQEHYDTCSTSKETED